MEVGRDAVAASGVALVVAAAVGGDAVAVDVDAVAVSCISEVDPPRLIMNISFQIRFVSSSSSIGSLVIS